MWLAELAAGAPRAALVLALLGAGAGWAQNIPSSDDWRETSAPPPPAFDVSRMVSLAVLPGSALTVGIDPSTISVGADGVVRYVFIARSNESGGALNVSYEGIRCANAEFRRYARWQADGGWMPLAGQAGAAASSAGGSLPGDWQPLRSPNGRYQFLLARGGICRDAAPNISAQQIVQDMRSSPFRQSP